MEFKSIIEELLPIKLRSQVVKCQNAMRYFISLHQTSVEKLDWAENAEAKRNIILAEQKMLEINDEQKKVIRKIDMILDTYCKYLKTSGVTFDRDIIFGTANRLIGRQLERTVQRERPPPEVMRAAISKADRASMLRKQQAKAGKKKGSPVRNPFALPQKIVSPQMNNSRKNLLAALKKVKVQEDEDEDAKEATGEDTDPEFFASLHPEVKLSTSPFEGSGRSSRANLSRKFSEIQKLPEGRRKRKTVQPILEDETCEPNTSSESSEKSSRRESVEEVLPRQPTSIEELSQEEFLGIFNLLTPAKLREYQTRRVSRRRRNCTSTNRKDFHYGSYEPPIVRLNSNKPVLYTPSPQNRRKIMEPLQNRAKLLPPSPLKTSTRAQSKTPTKTPLPSSSSLRRLPKTETRDLKPCIQCSRMEDTEKMNACLICYNFYHLTCHVLARELRERENMCPGCLKRMVEKKKRQLETKKQLKVQVLQAQLKAKVLESKQNKAKEVAV